MPSSHEPGEPEVRSVRQYAMQMFSAPSWNPRGPQPAPSTHRSAPAFGPQLSPIAANSTGSVGKQAPCSVQMGIQTDPSWQSVSSKRLHVSRQVSVSSKQSPPSQASGLSCPAVKSQLSPGCRAPSTPTQTPTGSPSAPGKGPTHHPSRVPLASHAPPYSLS